MGKDSRRRSKIAKERARNRPPAGPTSVHDLTDDLLDLVLLRLDSPLCLVRAASTCKRWRRVVADADGAFLRRFKTLHRVPPAIGHYYTDNPDPPKKEGTYHYAMRMLPAVDPVFLPSSSLPAGGPVGRQRRLSLDFVPGRGRHKDGNPQVHREYYYPDIVVCEPLTRRYQGIIIPREYHYSYRWLGAFLLDGDDDPEDGRGAIGMDNFKVLLVLYKPDENRYGQYAHGFPVASVFSSGSDGGWVKLEDEESGSDDDDGQYFDGVYLPRPWEMHLAGRTGGCIYSRGLPGRKEEYFSGPANIIKAGEGFVVLSPDEEKWLFSVDLDTLELEREHKRNKCTGPAFPYAPPWPPVLRACVETGGKRRHRR
ncbi:hypothetical protein ACP70R_006586 [Stipagrostis hirtigluma subsp. patula]